MDFRALDAEQNLSVLSDIAQINAKAGSFSKF